MPGLISNLFGEPVENPTNTQNKPLSKSTNYKNKQAKKAAAANIDSSIDMADVPTIATSNSAKSTATGTPTSQKSNVDIANVSTGNSAKSTATGTPTSQESNADIANVNTGSSVRNTAIGTPTSQESTADVPTANTETQRTNIDAYEQAPIADQESSFEERAPTETGVGTEYAGKTEAEILADSQQGLISMLGENSPLMQKAAAEGARSAEARGLGGSSLRERAA